MASIESRIADVAKNGYFPSPVSRRAFITVAAAAGVALGLGSTPPRPGVVPGSGAVRCRRRRTSRAAPTYCQVTTLSNDFFVAFNDGAKQFTSALGLDLTTLEDDANVNTALSQVGNIQTAGGQMMFGTPASEAQSEAVIKACDEAGIYYGSAYTSPKFLTPADYPTLGALPHATVGHDLLPDGQGALRRHRRVGHRGPRPGPARIVGRRRAHRRPDAGRR